MLAGVLFFVRLFRVLVGGGSGGRGRVLGLRCFLFWGSDFLSVGRMGEGWYF